MLKFLILVLAILQVNSLAISKRDDKKEIDQEQFPCAGKQVGDRLKHPSDSHKFLRCVSADTVWIETCPDNLFFNAKLDLCDWGTETMSTTTVATNEVVKNRAVLFKITKQRKLIEQLTTEGPLITIPFVTVASTTFRPTTIPTTTEVTTTTTTEKVEHEVISNVTQPTTTPLQMKVNFRSFFGQNKVQDLPVLPTLTPLVTLQPLVTFPQTTKSPEFQASPSFSALTTSSISETLPTLPLLPKLNSTFVNTF